MGYQALTRPSDDAGTMPPFHDTLHLLPRLGDPQPFPSNEDATDPQPPPLVARPPLSNLPFGHFNTYTSFTPPSANRMSAAVETRIDFVFMHASSWSSGWRALRHGVIDNWIGDDGRGWRGRWSDHRAVVVQLGKAE